MDCSREYATWACPWSRSITLPPAILRRQPPETDSSAASRKGDRHGHHRPSPSSQITGERNPDELDTEDCARRGHLLPDHLRLDPHTRPLRPREEPPGLDP